MPFAAAVAVVAFVDASSALTAVCGWAYLAARVAFVPTYAFGWVPWRTVFFAGGYVATGVMLIADILRT